MMFSNYLLKNTSGRLKTIWFAALFFYGITYSAVNTHPTGDGSNKIHGDVAPLGVKINEVFPRAQTDVAEWFELINTSMAPVNLKNWRFGNAQDTNVLTKDSLSIDEGRFLVITKDKTAFSRKYPSVSRVCQPLTWRTLDNYRDTLSLWNESGVLCERIAYNADWFEHWTDQSLERVSLQRDGMAPETWALATNPTPGQPNASIAFRAAEKPSIAIGPSAFTPNGDGKDDLLFISLVLPASFTVVIAIYGFDGKKYIDMPITPQPHYVWDGKTDNGSAAPVGPFFVVATFKNNGQTTIVRKRGILWR